MGDGLSEELAPLSGLPDWLVAAVRPETVREAIARAVPAWAAGEPALARCEVARVRMKKQSWVGIYRLGLAAPGGQEWQLQLQGTLAAPGSEAPAPEASAAEPGEQGWQCFLPDLRLRLETWPEEASLPALTALTDPALALDLIERSIRAAAPAYSDLAIATCAPRVVRHKPGSRGTVLYDLTYAADRPAAWPELVVAKTYKGGKGRHADAAMRALWASPMGASATVAIAEPLGYEPALNTLFQGPVREEQVLKDLIRAALRSGDAGALVRLERIMRKVAAGLAELHRSGVGYGERHSWEDELGGLQATVDQLGAVFPQLRASAGTLLARLDALAGALPADPPVPSHGSFRPDQVLIAGEAIGFIDFDGFCQAEPAFDLSRFLAATKNVGLSEPHEEESGEDDRALDPQARAALLGRLDQLCAAFVAEYERHAPLSRRRLALWETLDLLDLVLGCWTKIKPARLDNTLAMLERHLRGAGLGAGARSAG